MSARNVAVFVDADNVSSAAAKNIFEIIGKIGNPIVRRAYGAPSCFGGEAGWQLAQREYGISSFPQVSNLKGKNAADIALVIDAMECLYTKPLEAFFIVSSDSDYTALARKIRESGKEVYGIGKAQTPVSFKAACTQYFVLPKIAKNCKNQAEATVPVCPRCGAKLQQSWTKSREGVCTCVACGGMSAKLSILKQSFEKESCDSILEVAKKHEQSGCTCPDCGNSMSLVKVARGKQTVEIDVCAKCHTVWYDKTEFETLVPTDGVLQTAVSAGKAYRREVATALAADLRMKRIAPKSVAALKAIIKGTYHAPVPDIPALVQTLCSQQVVKIAKNGTLTLNVH